MIKIRLKTNDETVSVGKATVDTPQENVLIIKGDPTKEAYEFQLTIQSWPPDAGAVVSFKSVLNKKYVADSNIKQMLIANSAKADNSEKFRMIGDDEQTFYLKSLKDTSFVSCSTLSIEGNKILMGNAAKKKQAATFSLEPLS